MYLLQVIRKAAHSSVTSSTKVVCRVLFVKTVVIQIWAISLEPIIARLIVETFQMRQQRSVMNKTQIAHLALVAILLGVDAVMNTKVACSRKSLITNITYMRLHT